MRRNQLRATAVLLLGVLVPLAVYLSIGRGNDSGEELPISPPVIAQSLVPDGIRDLTAWNEHYGAPGGPSTRAALSHSPPEASPGETTARTTLRVFDFEGDRVGGVTLSVRDGRLWRTLGLTDAEGELAVDRERIASSGIIADAPRSALVVNEMPDEPQAIQEIHLLPAGTIRGRVLLPDGRAAGAGIQIYARINGYEAAGATSVRRAALSDRFGTTEEGGNFVVPRLAPNRLYSLSAGGRGIVSKKEVLNVQPDTESVDIHVRYVVGAILEFRGLEGTLAPVLPVRRFDGRRRVAWPDGKVLNPTTKEAALAGVSERLANGDNPRLILFTTDTSPADGYAAVATVNEWFPGYQPCSAHVLLGWLGEPVPRYGLPLQPEAGGFGDLIVSLTPEVPQGQWGWRPSRAVTAPATLILLQPELSEEGGVFQVDLHDFFNGPSHVSGIPHGTYSVQVSFNEIDYRFPPAESGQEYETVIISDTPATLDFSLEGLATLEVKMTEPGGAPYRGSAKIELGVGLPVRSSEGDLEITVGSGMAEFEQAPYVFAGLYPDLYHILPFRPNLARGQVINGLPPSIEVRAGENAVITVVVGGTLK